VKVYALDRIKELTATTEKFVFPVDFVAAEFLNASIGIMKTDTDKACEINIKLMLKQHNIYLLYRCTIRNK